MYLHTETSSLSKQKKNVDPCEFCGFVVGRKDDIRHHAKRHTPDSEYVEFCAFSSFFFLLRYVVGNYLDLRKDANSQLSKNQASKHIIVVRSFLSIERVFLFFLNI